MKYTWEIGIDTELLKMATGKKRKVVTITLSVYDFEDKLLEDIIYELRAATEGLSDVKFTSGYQSDEFILTGNRPFNSDELAATRQIAAKKRATELARKQELERADRLLLAKLKAKYEG